MKTFFRCVIALILISNQSFIARAQTQPLIDSLNESSFRTRGSDRTLSMQTARRALRLSEAISYEKGIRHAQLTLAVHYTTRAQYDSALTVLRLIMGHLGDPVKEGIAQFLLGRNYSALRDYKLAKINFDAAGKVFESKTEELLKKPELKDYVAAVPNSLGSMEMNQANYNEALTYFSQAMELQLKHGIPHNKELHNIAMVYGRLGNFDKSLSFMKKALNLAYDLRDTLAIVRTMTNLATSYKQASKIDSALIFYDNAYDLAIRKRMMDDAANALLHQAEIKRKSGQPREALALLRRTVNIVPKTNSGNLTHTYERLAESFGDLKQYDSAIFYARKSYQLSVKTNYIALARTSSLMLSEFYRKVYRTDSAFKYIDRHMVHNGEYEKINNESQFSDLRVRIETLEKDKEIDTLQAKAELENLKSQRLYLALATVVFFALLLIGTLVTRHRMAARKNQIEQLQLRSELDKNRENLYKQTLTMIQINNSRDDIHEQIKEMLTTQFDVRLARLANLVKTNRNLKNDWDSFNDYFSNVHASFYSKLSEMNPNLTGHEKRVCALIKLNLSNRQIATLLGIETKSVVMIKYRVKKKLQINDAADLEAAVQMI